MENKFAQILKEKGWLKALEEVKMPTQFWLDNFKSIPDNYIVRNELLNSQRLEEYFLAFVIKQGWMEPRGISENDNLNWYVISTSQKLSEAFIDKFADKLDWFFISINQELSESFIERHSEHVDWWLISQHQKLSKEFIERHKDKLDEEQLERNIFI